MVTGGGKTLFALLAFQRYRARVPDGRLLVLVPTLALLDQWAVALECDVGLEPNDIGTYSGEGQAPRPRVANVAVLNTARTLTNRLTRSGHWMLVVDECHRAGSPMNAAALDGRFEAVLGLSATPYRDFDDGFARYIEPAVGSVFYEYGYEQARADGVIAEFDLDNYEVPLTGKEHLEYDKLTRRIARVVRGIEHGDADGSEERLRRLQLRRATVANTAVWRIPSAAAVAGRYSGKMILFHERISAANAIADLLDRTSRRVERYHSAIHWSRRREALRRFRFGMADTLVTCRSLDEGLNVPDASVALIAASTRSRRQRIQRLGRVLRATSPDKRAVVATLYATRAERRFLESEQGRLADVAEVRWFSPVIGS